MFRRFLNLGGALRVCASFWSAAVFCRFLTDAAIPIEFLVIFETSAAPGFPAEVRDSQFAQIRLPLANAIQNHARDRLRGCLPERDRHC